MTDKCETCRNCRINIVLSFLKVLNLYAILCGFHGSPNVEDWMCELCMHARYPKSDHIIIYSYRASYKIGLNMRAFLISSYTSLSLTKEFARTAKEFLLPIKIPIILSTQLWLQLLLLLKMDTITNRSVKDYQARGLL